ncbi:Histidine acid phosphatase [Pleurostoma richardsiae]|uniref:Histidine acid phosphatase n=1 Tax=Pleurostoma richardsiae TaxID=41990 RepID=A0AA38R5A4_9PEZI|nr:Histidine acid phosphatase [Pleurostoma richardsiae]
MELTYILAGLLPLLSPAAAETVLGAYVFHRHGDRTSKSTPPTSLTALGADEVYVSGSYYRSRYVAENGTSQILAIQPNVVKLSQLSVVAPVDNVLYNSAQVFLQGLYPPAGSAAEQTLANGSTVEAPLNGYQYIPISASSAAASSSGSEDSGWLQGSSGCGNAVVSSNDYFKSDEFVSTQSRTLDFYHSILPVINATFTEDETNFKNAYTIWDLIHVATIHNSSIPSDYLLTNSSLHQLQTLADAHEWGLAYNASEPIRAISGSVLAGQILDALNTTVLAAPAKTSAQRLSMQFGAYGTFMSFFGLAGLPAASANFYGIVDYASSMTFELVTNATVDTNSTSALSTDDISVRFLFANGSASDSNPLTAYPLFGQAETVLSWADFVSGMQEFTISDTASWCAACGNTTGTCASYSSSSSSGSDSGSSNTTSTDKGGNGVSKPVAGVIGALVTLVVILGVEGLVMAIGGLRLTKKRSQAAAAAAGTGAATGEGVKA